MAVLEVRRLNVRIPTGDGVIHAVQDVSFDVEPGKWFGIAGESGSGKSVLTQAVLGLLPSALVSGEIRFEGRNLLSLPPSERRSLRGARIGIVFQDTMSSLHPYYTVGKQIAEMIHAHERTSRSVARDRVVEMLERVGIADATSRCDHYPHQFSGGMRQRVMIAMALVLNPPLIIADEPTTALDVTVQAQIIDLLDQMRRDLGTTIVMITHDLGLLARVAENVMVMYAGNRMELGSSGSIFADPVHPYTAGLLRSAPSNRTPGTSLSPIPGQPPSLLSPAPGCAFSPRCNETLPACKTSRPPLRIYDDGTRSLCWLESETRKPVQIEVTPTGATDPIIDIAEPPLLSVSGLRFSYPQGGLFGRHSTTEVLQGIDFSMRRGETLGIVGESGCGKSTLARVIAGLIPATSGDVILVGKNVTKLDNNGWQALRRTVQVVFQDPFGSLNPRRRVGAIIGDPFRIHRMFSGAERKREVRRLMEIVGLNPEHYNRFPSEFSGGQRQRIGIARALALKPDLIICDEPVSALDVSIQAQVLNLMSDLQKEFGLSYLFISHDLAVVRHICDRIAVMEKGKIVEIGEAGQVTGAPRHPYTKALLAAASPTITPSPAGIRRTLVDAFEERAA
jgi:peptide/nickel transport system ATP-binding protein